MTEQDETESGDRRSGTNALTETQNESLQILREIASNMSQDAARKILEENDWNLQVFYTSYRVYVQLTVNKLFGMTEGSSEATARRRSHVGTETAVPHVC